MALTEDERREVVMTLSDSLVEAEDEQSLRELEQELDRRAADEATGKVTYSDWSDVRRRIVEQNRDASCD